MQSEGVDDLSLCVLNSCSLHNQKRGEVRKQTMGRCLSTEISV